MMNQLLDILRSPVKLLLTGFAITIIGVIIFTVQEGQTILTQILMIVGSICSFTAIVKLIIRQLSPRKV